MTPEVVIAAIVSFTLGAIGGVIFTFNVQTNWCARAQVRGNSWWLKEVAIAKVKLDYEKEFNA